MAEPELVFGMSACRPSLPCHGASWAENVDLSRGSLEREKSCLFRRVGGVERKEDVFAKIFGRNCDEHFRGVQGEGAKGIYGTRRVGRRGADEVGVVMNGVDVNVGVSDSERFEDADGVGDVEYYRKNGVALDTACLAGQGMGLGGESEGGRRRISSLV
eukprot:scaffold21738_cov129-Isochrysis_galbana.AAC.4